MPTVRRPSGWSAWCLCAVLPAQQSAADIRAALSANDAATVATAADRARQLDDGTTQRAVHKALAAWARRDDADAALVRLHLLDAAIQRQVHAPGELLAPMVADRVTRTAALILLCRAPLQNERHLFALLRDTPLDELHRTAIGSLLADQRAAGLAAWLWRELPADLRITAVEPGTLVTFGMQTPDRAPRPERPVGFPEAPRYELVPDHRALGGLLAERLPADLEPLVSGPDPLGFVRTPRGALTAAEASRCDVGVEVTLVDQRGDRRVGLPDIAAAK